MNAQNEVHPRNHIIRLLSDGLHGAHQIEQSVAQNH